LEKAVNHPIFFRSIRLLDILQRAYMWTVGVISPTRDSLTVFGATLRCDTRDFVQRRIRFFQIFEHNLTYYTLSKLREEAIYVDIGANIGYFSLLASGRVGPNGKVISVEADPNTYAALGANLKRNGCANVSARNVAATAGKCKVSINRRDSRNSGSNSIAMGDGDVDGLPFRDIVGDDLGRVRFIKIDIEGSEAPVLRSILEDLDRLPGDLIVASEVSPESAEYIELFIAAGFRAYAIQNIYSIDYYLIRSYLRKFSEEKAAQLFPVTTYNKDFTDYIFEREAPYVVVPAPSRDLAS
jgi:FkbM family methyltransferase